MKRAVKWMCAAGRLAVAAVLSFVASSAFATGNGTAKDYVQSGLLMQFDGIANNGWSAEDGDIHATAPTTPKELVANAAMTLAGTLQYGDNYILFPGSAYLTSGNLTSIKNALAARRFSVCRKSPIPQRGSFQPFESGRSASAAVFNRSKVAALSARRFSKRSKVALQSARRLSKRSKSPNSAI